MQTMGIPINQLQTDKKRQSTSTDENNKTTAQSTEEKPIPTQNEGQPLREFQVSTSKSFHLYQFLLSSLNMTFASHKVLFEFLCYSCLVIFIPIILVFSTYYYVKQDPTYSQLQKIVVSVAPSLVIINIVIGVYIYKAIKDPENYKKDPVIKPVIPVGFKEQNMNRRMKAKKQLSMQNEVKKEEAENVKQDKKPKNQ